MYFEWSVSSNAERLVGVLLFVVVAAVLVA